MKELLAVDVKSYIEKKNNMDYLSWANAWREIIKLFPGATYTIIKNDNGLPIFGNSEIGYMCYTTVTIKEITHEMWLPVMDFKNKAMLKPTMFEINKTVMRCLTKNLAMFGLGLDLYAGEDLQEGTTRTKTVNIRQQIINALNHANVTEADRDKYRDEVKANKWSFNEEFLTHLKKEHNIK
jgi:hypothetical protein